MPVAARNRTTSARKKAKLDVPPHVSATNTSQTPPLPQGHATNDKEDASQADAELGVSASSSASSRVKSKRTAAPPRTPNQSAVQATSTPSVLGTPAPQPPPPNTESDAKSSRSKSTSAKAKARAKASFEDADHLSATTLAKTTGSASRNANRKSKVELEQDDYDDQDSLPSGKTSDLDVYAQQGPLSTLNRIQIKTRKPRSLRSLWLQGVYQPPFFGIPPAKLVSLVSNDDADSQPEQVRNRSPANALMWPNNGLAKTWLDSAAYARIKKELLQFWLGQVGWVPNQGIYDCGWFPGKAFGWAQNLERSRWAQDARRHLVSKQATANNVVALGNLPGWPFVQPWINMQFQNLTLLSSKDAQVFLKDTTTPQQTALRHPTTVMKLAVPELNMRSRLKPSTIRDTSNTASSRRTNTVAGGGAQIEADADEDDEAAAAADQDQEAITALDANQEPIDLSDARFANIANLGFQENGPICGDVLHLSVGPPDQEVPVQIAKGTSRRLDSLGVVPDQGHLMNAGGHVYALDWVPVPVHLNTGKEYFVVSAAASNAPITMIGAKQQANLRASLQIWSVSPDSAASSAKGEARLDMVICHQAGTAFKLAWCPIGYDYGEASSSDDNSEQQTSIHRLGVLAGCFADGSVSVFSIPHPECVARKHTKSRSDEPIYVELEPIVKLEHPLESATSVCWAGGEMIALGGSKGWLGVWNIGRMLRCEHAVTQVAAPDYVVRAHRSAITDVTFILLPRISADGIAVHASLPMTLFTVSLDGLTSLVDLSRCEAGPIERSRTVHYCCAFSAFSGGSLVHEHADGSVAHYSLRPEEMLRARTISHTPSRVMALSASDHHPMLAMATAHGELKLANSLRTLKRNQRFHLPVFQQILDRSTGRLVLRHHLLPDSASLAEPRCWHLANWHPKLGVTAVSWNPNLARASLLLSGSATGMLSVHVMSPPYETA